MKTHATTVGAFEAKNTFPELLEKAGRGTEISITKHDKPVARLAPATEATRAARLKATAELRTLSKRYSLRGLPVRALIDEGRP